MKRYLDEIDASEEGYRWLHDWIESNPQVRVDSIRSSTHHNDGLTVIGWASNIPILMFVVSRDILNRSILYKAVFDEEN